MLLILSTEAMEIGKKRSKKRKGLVIIALNGHIKSFKPPLGLDERSKANVGMSRIQINHHYPNIIYFILEIITINSSVVRSVFTLFTCGLIIYILPT